MAVINPLCLFWLSCVHCRCAHLERQPSLDLVLKRLGDGAIEVGQDLHRQLGIDAVIADEIVQRVSQREADAALHTRG